MIWTHGLTHLLSTSVSEDVEEDMYNWVHRRKAHCPLTAT